MNPRTVAAATEFLAAVLPSRHDDEVYRVEVFPRPPVAANNFISIEAMARHLLRFGRRPHNAYFALATFPARGQDRKAAHARRFGCLWADLDVGPGKPHSSKEIAVARVKALALEPLAIVDSGRGVHIYWGLAEPIDPAGHDRLVGLLRGLTRALDGDLGATLKSQILRLPGTWNIDSMTRRKDGHDYPVRLVELNRGARRYTLDDVVAAGIAPVTRTLPPVSAGCGHYSLGQRHRSLVTDAVRLRTLGLDADEIDGALQVINQKRCQQPKPTDEVRAIADWAGALTPRALGSPALQRSPRSGGPIHVA